MPAKPLSSTTNDLKETCRAIENNLGHASILLTTAYHALTNELDINRLTNTVERDALKRLSDLQGKLMLAHEIMLALRDETERERRRLD